MESTIQKPAFFRFLTFFTFLLMTVFPGGLACTGSGSVAPPAGGAPGGATIGNSNGGNGDGEIAQVNQASPDVIGTRPDDPDIETIFSKGGDQSNKDSSNKDSTVASANTANTDLGKTLTYSFQRSYLIYKKGGRDYQTRDKFFPLDCNSAQTPAWQMDFGLREIEGRLQGADSSETLAGRKLAFLNFGNVPVTRGYCSLQGFLGVFGGTLENYFSKQIIPVEDAGGFKSVLSNFNERDQVAVLILNKDQDEDSNRFDPSQYLVNFEVRREVPPPPTGRPSPE